jgi:hypothetical protein
MISSGRDLLEPVADGPLMSPRSALPWSPTVHGVVFGVLLLAWLAPAVTAAQSVDVSVSGIVTDQTGAVLPGVTITATNSQTKLVRSATSDAAGLYGLPPLPAGVYEIKAELPGFRTQARSGLTLHVGTTISIDLTLEVAAANEAVAVVASVPVLETTKNTLSRLVAKEELDSLPVVDRNFNALAALVPGVTPTGAYGGVDIGGSRDYQNGYVIDGMSAEGLAVGEQRVRLSQDWIQEFQVLTSQYNVEFGRASGGVVNAITRSGTNNLAGRAYGFFRNEAWDATPAFAGSKAPLDIKRLGGTIGGRIVPNRLFYFGGVEWFDNASSNAVNSSFPAENRSVPFTTREELYVGKIDAHPNPSRTYRTRYNRQRSRSSNAGVGGTSTEEFGVSADASAYDVVGSAMHVLAARVFNEFRAAFSDTSRATVCNFAGRNPPGTWFERRYPGARFGCPEFGRTAIGELQMIDNMSWTWGRHDFKAGVDISRARSSGDLQRSGLYRFATDIPFDISNPASFPVFFGTFLGQPAWNYSWWSWGGFVQDSWRLRSDLTLNLGVRYDVDGSYTALNGLIRADRGLTRLAGDVDNIAPRAGIAWQPFGTGRGVLVRGGAGLYYDQNHANVGTLLLVNNILVDRQVTVSVNEPGLNPFWPDIARARRFLAEGLAQNAIPDLGSLRTVSGATTLDGDLGVPATVQASVGLARDSGRGLSASADVVYSRGIDQYIIRDVNIDRAAALDDGRIVRPNPNYSFLNSYGNGGRFTYRAVQMQASFAPGPRHLAKLAYTLAKNESNTFTVLSGAAGGVGATNPFDYDEDKGPADNDVRHALTVNGFTTLPFDTRLSAIVAYRSALPYSVTTPLQLDPDPFPDRPEPRNSRRGDSFVSLDARLAKVFRVTSRRSVTGFVEVFNVTNAANLIRYVGALGSSLFGQPTGALEKRRTQVGFRVDF